MPSENERNMNDMSHFEMREYLGLQDWEVPDSEHLVLHCRHPKYDAWAIKAIFEVQSQDVKLSHLTIYPVGDWSPPGGLTDEVRRTVPLDKLRKMACTRLQLQEVAGSVGVDPSAFRASNVRGRKGRTELDLARIARDYDELQSESDHAVDELAERMNLNVATVRGIIWQARKRGLLSPAPAGQAGGHITDKAKTLLDAASNDSIQRESR